jgi:hypothetical protein
VKLVLIYGKPAVGKLTVARALSRQTGWRLFHNHLTVNLVLALHDFGTPEFVALRERIWSDAFHSAVAAKVPVLIFTFNPESTVPQRFVDELVSFVETAGGEVIPVELTASEDEIGRRLASKERISDGKHLDATRYCQLRDSGAFDSPAMPRPRISIDTSASGPEESARRIAALLA